MTKTARVPRSSEPRRGAIDASGGDAIPDAAAHLLVWYDRHRRAMPWRAVSGQAADPYGVWLSEIMLQVAAVRSYWLAFMARWPNVDALAAAPVDDVMKAWAGLGYYSRARNLHACAVTVSRDFGGAFPTTEAGLRKLPGIGAYTAAAVAAIAFGEPAAVVDGNVERVISRLLAIATPFPQAKPLIARAVARMVPHDRPGDFAQATMDLGATICTPRRPACALCPWRESCRAAKAGTQDQFPVKAAKRARVTRYGAVFVARRVDGAVLVGTRPPRGMLGGMTEFPGTAWRLDRDVDGAPPLPAAWDRATPVLWSFTHFDLELMVHVASMAADTPAPQGLRWVSEAALADEGLPSVMRKVFDAAAPYGPQRDAGLQASG